MTSGPRVTDASAAATGLMGMPPLCRVTLDRGGHSFIGDCRLAIEDWGYGDAIAETLASTMAFAAPTSLAKALGLKTSAPKVPRKPRNRR